MIAHRIESRAPQDLRPHPLIAAFPRWDRESDEWAAFVEDIRRRGIQNPIEITAGGEVVDGETRRQAALVLSLPSVPVRLAAQDEISTTILQHLQLCRNLTKGQRAYLAVPLLDGARAEGLARRARQLKHGATEDGRENPVFESDGWGFCRRLLGQARELRKLFDADADLRAEWEPKVLDPHDPVGLGAAIAGIAGAAATEGKERVVAPASDLWLSGFRTFALRTLRIGDVSVLRPGIRRLVSEIDDSDGLDRMRRVATELSEQVRARQRELAKDT